MDLTWFRRPADDRPGTLNLCYNAVDRHVIAGAAEHTAVRAAARDLGFATLLEEVGALAGVLRGLGVETGSVVAAALDDPLDRLLVLLAALRIGGVYAEGAAVAATVAVVSTGATTGGGSAPGAPVRIHRGVPVEDPEREVDWEVAMSAGRTDPAPCLDVPGDAAAYVVDGVEVAARNAVGHMSWMGAACATLCAGQTLDLTGGPA